MSRQSMHKYQDKFPTQKRWPLQAAIRSIRQQIPSVPIRRARKAAARLLLLCGLMASLALASLPPLLSPAQGQELRPESEAISTVWGTLGVLRLLEGEASKFTPEMRAKLGINSQLVVVKQSPVYSAIQHYLEDASVHPFFAEADRGEGYINYSINDGRSTFNSDLRDTTGSGRETQRQTQQQFERDGLRDENVGKTRAQWMKPIKPLSTNLTDAPYTTFSRSENVGTIHQYPALASIKPYNQQSVPALDGKSEDRVSPNPWLQAIIQANPQLRGLIGFSYGFDIRSNPIPGCEEFTVNRVRQFIPYVRFATFNLDRNLDTNPLRFKLAVKDANLSPYAIRSLEAQSTPASASKQTLEFNADSTLKAGTTLLLPVEFGFQFIPSQEFSEPRPWINPVFVKAVQSDALEQISLPQPFIAAMKTDDTQLPFSHRLLVGPTIEEVKLRSSQPFKDQQVAMLNMDHMMGRGSCPFLVYYDRDNQYWTEYGTVLVNRKAKNLQADEQYLIRRNVSKILIQEREDETSYIDAISLAYKDRRGNEQRLQPADPTLRDKDGSYAILRRGESVEVDFSALPAAVSEVTVHISGYYVPEASRHRDKKA